MKKKRKKEIEKLRPKSSLLRVWFNELKEEGV